MSFPSINSSMVQSEVTNSLGGPYSECARTNVSTASAIPGCKAKILGIAGACGEIGRQVAHRGLTKGWTVVGGDQRFDADLLEELRLKGSVKLLRVDFCAAAEVDAFIEELFENETSSDGVGLIVTVGRVDRADRDLLDTSWKVVEDDWRTNLLPYNLLAEAAVRASIKRQIPLSIGLATSVNSFRGGLGQLGYSYASMCKIVLAQKIAAVYARNAIRINCAAFATIVGPTPQWSERLKKDPWVAWSIAQSNPTNLTLTADQAAEHLIWLVSDSSNFLNGQNIIVDGGADAAGGAERGSEWRQHLSRLYEHLRPE